jgi:GTP cyclohydrolase II
MAGSKRAAEKELDGAPTTKRAGTAERSTPTGPLYLSLTTHPGRIGARPSPLHWYAKTAAERGAVLASVTAGERRNAIGAYGGSYCIFRGLAVAAGTLQPDYLPDYEMTEPVVQIGPFPSWSEPDKIATFDPWGHVAQLEFKDLLDQGVDVRPTIAVTRAHMDFPEVIQCMREGKLTADGTILKEDGKIAVTKAAIEPVWYIPGVARKLDVSEAVLRRSLFHQSGGAFPELLTRGDLDVFLPPIGGATVYIFGDASTIPDPDIPLAVRVHDECNGSDTFGSDICTCRPFLAYAIIDCVQTAQRGGCGVVVYFRREGRSLGETTKYLVYNRRKRQEGGDKATKYFECTSMVAGVEDVRFQQLMPDVLHWLGVTRIHRLLSMSNVKYDAIVGSGIEVLERVPLPEDMVPTDARVEIEAKVFAGYDGGQTYQVKTQQELDAVQGRVYHELAAEQAAAGAGGDDE